jgi:hypothetical protein
MALRLPQADKAEILAAILTISRVGMAPLYAVAGLALDSFGQAATVDRKLSTQLLKTFL